MTTIRRHLRLWVAAWLVFQVASLSALVPRDCCAAHQPATENKSNDCHKTAATTHCPMRAAGGASCPIHRESQADAREPSSHTCSIRGTCDGPLVALVALLSNHGPLTDVFEMTPDLRSSQEPLDTRADAIGRFTPPDPPPPRA